MHRMQQLPPESLQRTRHRRRLRTPPPADADPQWPAEQELVPQRRAACAAAGAARDPLRPHEARTRCELLVRVYPDKVHLDSHETGADRRRARVGRALLGAGLACRRRRRGRSARVASARRALRRRARRLDRARSCGRRTPPRGRSSRCRRDGAAAGAGVSRPPTATARRRRRRGAARLKRAAAGPLDRGRLSRAAGRAGRHRPRHRASAGRRARSRAQADAPTVARRRARDRRRHALDDRLRRGRSRGMALRMRLTPAGRGGIDSRCSCSASAASLRPPTAPPSRGAARRASLHRRAELPAPGTPSNNTGGAARRRTAAPIPGDDAQLRRGVGARAALGAGQPNARALGAALGLDGRRGRDVLGRVAGAGGSHELDARAA